MSGLRERLAQKLCGPLCHHDSVDGYRHCETQADRLLPVVEREIAAARGEALREAADDLTTKIEGWYGSSVFPNLPPEFEWAMLDNWLSDTFGFRIDRLSAFYYREVMDRDARLLRHRADELRAALSPDPDRGEGEA